MYKTLKIPYHSSMEKKKLQIYFFLALFALVVALSFFIFRPFLATLLVAATFAVIFEPLHRFLLKFMPRWPGTTTGLTVILICLAVLLPLFAFGFQVFREASDLFEFLKSKQQTGDISEFSRQLREWLGRYLPGLNFDFEQLSRQFLNWLVQNLGGLFAGFFAFALNLFLFIVALYYFLKDGKKLFQAVKVLSPLPDNQDEHILRRLELAINSVIKGALAIALIQGMLTSLGFWIFDVPHPILWGSLAAIAALIPSVGTALVIAPAIAFLYFTGQTGAATGLTIWGAGAVGLIDNLLSPILINRGIKLHPFIILLSVLGGLALFGPVGFLLGPLVTSLLFALLDIHFEVIKAQ